MALNNSHVTVATDGTLTLPAGSICTARFTILLARAVALLAQYNQKIPTGAESAATLRGLANAANDDGDWLYLVLTTMTHARISAGQGELQKIPSPNNPGDLTDPSGADVDLPLV